MDPNVQGSFIPKQALNRAQSRGGGLGLFFLASILVFVMSLIAAGGAFAYQGVLNKQIADKDVSLQKAEGAFDATAIDDLLRMDTRLTQAKLLLDKHVSTSGIFTLLSQITLEKVQILGMNLTMNTDGSGKLSANGVGDSFSTVALQSDAFGSSKFLRDVIFSGVSVGEGGKVSFNVSATVDPSVLLYRNATGQSRTTPQPQGTTTPPAI